MSNCYKNTLNCGCNIDIKNMEHKTYDCNNKDSNKQECFNNSNICGVDKVIYCEGPIGATGATGAVGPTGSGNGILAYGYAANCIGDEIMVVCSGTKISLPNEVKVENIIFDNNNEFTIINTGVYQVVYGINLLCPIMVGSRLAVNGEGIKTTTLYNKSKRESFNITAVLNLNSKDRLSLELFGVADMAILTNDCIGAFVSIMQLS